MFKLTIKLEDEWREKVNFLRRILDAKNNRELFEKMANFFIERDRLERIDKIELTVEQLATRMGWVEEKIRRLEDEPRRWKNEKML